MRKVVHVVECDFCGREVTNYPQSIDPGAHNLTGKNVWGITKRRYPYGDKDNPDLFDICSPCQHRFNHVIDELAETIMEEKKIANK